MNRPKPPPPPRSPVRVTVQVDRRFHRKVDGAREVAAGTTLAELLESLGIGPAVPAVVLVDGHPRPPDYVLLADERVAVVPPKSLKGELISWAKAIGVALVIWIFLRSYLIEAFRIPSASMENTLLVGDFLFVNKAIYGGELEIPLTGVHVLRVPGYGSPHRDQVVVFRSVEDSTPNLNIVKRIIGAPGDTLQMVRDTVIRNGQRLDEPYALHLADGGGGGPPAKRISACARSARGSCRTTWDATRRATIPPRTTGAPSRSRRTTTS